MSYTSKAAYLIDLLIIPLIMVSYYQSLRLTALLDLGVIYFFFILFVMIHFCSSMITILSNYAVYRKIRGSMWLLGFGPTVVAIFTLLTINLLPFLKWPFYIFKWVPHFDKWITPFIMGLSAFITQVLLRKTVNDSIFEVDEKLQLANEKQGDKTENQSPQ